MQLFVGSLPFVSTEADIKKLFGQFGAVTSVTILMNKEGRKSRGFGFVEMADEHAARAAIAGLDNKEFMGRALKVTVARPKPIKEPDPEQKREPRLRSEFCHRQFPPREEIGERSGFKPGFERPVRFKGGRRSRSYLRKITGKTDDQIRTIREESPAQSWQKRRRARAP